MPGEVVAELPLLLLDECLYRAPSEDALSSQQPFCIDTLEFTEWLQFVFLERMRMIVEQGHSLPGASGIAPMAEEYFRARPESGDGLVRELEAIDELLSGS